jgi:hypothetical protein
MIVNEYIDPWKHLVIDNFLDPDVFASVESYITSNYDLNNIKSSVLEVHSEKSNSMLFQLLSPLIFKLRDKYFAELNFANKPMPETVYPYIELAICNPGFRYNRIHTDDLNFKVMTTILYVTPEDGDGTELYSDHNKSKLIKTLEWKKNRALIFVGTSNPEFQQTWHNYGNTKPHGRASINMILSKTPTGKF